MTPDERAAARARRDEARTVNATEPLRCRAALLRVIDDTDALDAALDAVEKERDALKATIVTGHVHHFKRLTYLDLFALTKWCCACGLRVKSTAVAKALEGKPR